MKKCLGVFILLGVFVNAQNTEAPSWVDFAEKKLNGNLSEATLNDFSYTGYHFSEKELPDVSGWNTISVTDYGAIPDDTGYDDAGIQAAIDAAEASNQPTVVFFPAGRYIVSSETTKTQPITISGSNIVLKGAGKGTGGTEIYADKFNENKFGSGAAHYRFMFIPSNTESSDITQVTSEIKKGDFEIQVASTANLVVGQYVDLYQRTTANLEANMMGLTPNVNWGAIKNNGIRPYEKHLITKISGNKVTFKNPVQLNMPVSSTTVLRTYNTITEVGVEDILFTSGWKDYPENFVHHANEIIDYAWQSVYFGNVVNGWIRDCDFKDWNECLFIERSLGFTAKDIHIYGKRGHTSYYSKYSYGVLFENCLDTCSEGLTDGRKGMLHGPGMRWSTTSTVFLNCEMQKDQSTDCHGYHPYSNLLDNIQGGKLLGNGGAENAYPNSGPYLTFWNFKHDANFTTRLYDFWFVSNTTERRTHTFANPIFVGFQTKPGDNIMFKNEGLDELRGQQVYPNSLFDAQLQLRLYGGYMSASSSKDNFEAKLANDGDGNTFWESEIAGSGQWLMLDLGTNKTISEISIKEPASKIKDWRLEYWEASGWKELVAGTEIGAEKKISAAISARKIRFNVLNMLPGQELSAAAISEFKLTTSTQLASNNFTIEVTGETCKDKGNGKVFISAAATHNYKASIDGLDYEFTDSKTIENLAPGTYDLCIDLVGDSHKQCYEITIDGGASLSGKIKIEKKSAQISVQSGAGPYTVFKNGKQLLETIQSDFSVQVEHGDKLQVKGKDACQGELSKNINLLEEVKAYPNPSSGEFELYLPTSLEFVNVQVYNLQSQLVSSKDYKLSSGRLILSLLDKPNGIYFAKVNVPESVFVKLIKR
ncbi:DUF4955 domain-containing protein [Tamlana crocina]|uniref:DUF4955 domain-containing protein n=1 Tax=Tamlana crocina TaxID=393006 RepID=A0ABX1D8I7_9FLAO|nr:DUF4955 domain-containing protein [Tamlana crocina]NJX14292.1 DUF4955 domain-containing protein [Tamlana crocina]